MQCNYKNLKLYNYVVDYKDKQGKDYNQAFQIANFIVGSPKNGAKALKVMFEEQGFIIVAITFIKGNYTLEELSLLAEGKLISKEDLKASIIKSEFCEL